MIFTLDVEAKLTLFFLSLAMDVSFFVARGNVSVDGSCCSSFSCLIFGVGMLSPVLSIPDIWLLGLTELTDFYVGNFFFSEKSDSSFISATCTMLVLVWDLLFWINSSFE